MLLSLCIAPVLDDCLQHGSTPVLGPVWVSRGERFSPTGVHEFLNGLIAYTRAKLKEAKRYQKQAGAFYCCYCCCCCRCCFFSKLLLIESWSCWKMWVSVRKLFSQEINLSGVHFLTTTFSSSFIDFLHCYAIMIFADCFHLWYWTHWYRNACNRLKNSFLLSKLFPTWIMRLLARGCDVKDLGGCHGIYFSADPPPVKLVYNLFCLFYL